MRDSRCSRRIARTPPPRGQSSGDSSGPSPEGASRSAEVEERWEGEAVEAWGGGEARKDGGKDSGATAGAVLVLVSVGLVCMGPVNTCTHTHKRGAVGMKQGQYGTGAVEQGAVEQGAVGSGEQRQ